MGLFSWLSKKETKITVDSLIEARDFAYEIIHFVHMAKFYGYSVEEYGKSITVNIDGVSLCATIFDSFGASLSITLIDSDIEPPDYLLVFLYQEGLDERGWIHKGSWCSRLDKILSEFYSKVEKEKLDMELKEEQLLKKFDEKYGG